MTKMLKIVGMLDPHTHLRDLDWQHKATFMSETAAAVAGGYWAVFDMPNTAPSTTNTKRLEHKLATINGAAVCDWGLYFGASQNNNTAQYEAVYPNTCGLKIYNNDTTGDLLIEDQVSRDQHVGMWSSERVIAVHAEGETVLDILELVRKHRKHTHFLHISTAEEIRYLTEAKNEGLPITIGVCPHHLYLTQDDVPALGGFGMMKPELKTVADRDALWAALADGVVDVVESDHAPHTIQEKQSQNPPFGVPGLETTLPLLLLAVEEGRLTLEQVIALVATNPQRIWNCPAPADTYTLVDLDASYVLDRDQLLTKCGWSPFEGMRVVGKVRETWIRGRKVFDGEQVCVEHGFGQNVFETMT